MNRALFWILVFPLLALECVAQFLLHDQQLTTLAALLALAVVAIRWALGPQTDAERAKSPGGEER